MIPKAVSQCDCSSRRYTESPMMALFAVTAMLALGFSISSTWADEPGAPSHLIAIPLSFVGKAEAEFDEIEAGLDSDEIIPSLNIAGLVGDAKIQIRAHFADHITKWYDLGTWSTKADLRTTVTGQKDADGDVLADTLRLASPCRTFDVRVSVTSTAPVPAGTLYVCFSRPVPEKPPEAPSATPGLPLPVPLLAQGDFPGGEVLCSPTSLSMVLHYWADKQSRPELAKTVNEISEAVWDKAYNGAGNWAFNAAFAGSMSRVRAYVTRLSCASDLEKWTAAGIPVVCSVASSMLEGKPLSPKEKGHLIVVVGFTAEGDVIVNNPSHRNQLRRIYQRTNFETAWQHSRRTVYIVHPESVAAPVGGRGMWVAALVKG